MNHLTSLRLAVVISSGFDDEEALADAVISNVAALGEDVLKQRSLSKAQTCTIERALHDTPIAYKSLRGIISGLPLQPEGKSNLLFVLAKLVDDMIILGASAMADDPSKEIAISVLNGAVRGGVNSGASRRASREKTWEPHAKKIANDLRVANPSISQDDIAAEIAFKWKADFSPPGHASLKKLVGRMEKSGELKKPVRRGTR